MNEDYVTRGELEQFERRQNGSLQRIEKKLDSIDKKMDESRNREEGCRQDLLDRISIVETARISKVTGAIIALLSSACVALLVIVFTYALR